MKKFLVLAVLVIGLVSCDELGLPFAQVTIVDQTTEAVDPGLKLGDSGFHVIGEGLITVIVGDEVTVSLWEPDHSTMVGEYAFEILEECELVASDSGVELRVGE